jgi:EAL domain-containing protein (putative c-di-GMP-specific phosphodiesterase class I)
VHLDTAIGGANGPSAAAPAELARNADLAMQAARGMAARMAVFEEDMHSSLVARIALQRDLRCALRTDDFELHYQPILCTHEHRVRSYEALIRWNHPERGPVSPAEFIPVAEQAGLIRGIGSWVLDEALRQLAEWRKDGLVDDDVSVSVNVSVPQLTEPGFAAQVTRTLFRHRVSPRNLTLEITESALMEHETAERELGAVRARGVTVALDDFGTGYSSLARLAAMPVDYLKIDKAFVADPKLARTADAMAATVIGLGHSLGLQVVAEGVETNEQLLALRRLGCDMVQGYLLSRPLPPDQAIGVRPTRPHGRLPWWFRVRATGPA